jgi:hypothetical protein
VPVNTKHEQYEECSDKWQRCRDTTAGSDAVKAAGIKYLPALSSDQLSSEYDSYKQRALFYNGMKRTVQGLVGSVFRKDQVFEVPEGVADHLKDITLAGLELETFARVALTNVLTVGRYGILVDMAPDGDPSTKRPHWAGYPAESIINWRTVRQGGQSVLTLVVLAESEDEVDPRDPFVVECAERWRVLELDESGLYKQTLYKKEKGSDKFVAMQEFLPVNKGNGLNYIPFVFLGPTSNSADVEDPPLIDLADVNLSHYRSSADLEHGRHYTALPTPWTAGWDMKTRWTIGSATAWVNSNPQATVGMLEFTGQGLGAIERALDDKERMMAALGSRMLEDQKRSAEAAETYQIRQSGEHSTLRSIAGACAEGIRRALAWHVEWAGGDPGQVRVELNSDFVDPSLTATDLTALVQAGQAGAISWETLYHNLVQGEIARPGVEAEEEKAGIDTEVPEEDL